MEKRGPFLLLVSVATAALFVVGCQHQESTSFPPGLDALATDTVPPPQPEGDGGDEYPETLSLTQGSDSVDNYNYVVATGYVDAPIEAVRAAFQIPNVVVDRHGITSYTVQENVETGYTVSFLTAYTIDGLATVNFDLTWREGVVAGTTADPTQVSVVYEKTYGSSFISLMEGSIQLVSVTPSVTELEFVQRMNAEDTSSQNIASWTTELFGSVVAQVHGQPLP